MIKQIMAGLTGENILNLWLLLFVVTGIATGVLSGFFKARKIQPNGFKWRIFRFEVFAAVITIVVSAFLLGTINGYLKSSGLLAIDTGPAAWWVIALEYVASFVLFDTYFYWLHRWMHNEPFYRWIHKLHHKSTSPNMLTTLSVHPLESVINGGFAPLFLTLATLIALPIHAQTVALMGVTTLVMGFYVHSGYEFFPRWWHKTWATKWFITTTFHDQHHKYFNWNFGGYTPVWDYLCGTVRKKYEADYEQICERRSARRAAVAQAEPAQA